MRNTVLCDMDLTEKRVALEDDVLTTGASLNPLTEAVRNWVALEISAWMKARTVLHNGS